MDQRDYDEMRRQFRGQIEKLPFRQIVIVAILVVGGIFAVWLSFSTFYTVDADEEGVVMRLGRYLDPPAGPGLHLKLPFGMDTVETVKVKRIETLAFGFRTTGVGTDGRTRYRTVPEESLMLTGDQNVVNVEWIVQYRIGNPAKWLFSIKDPVGTLRDVSESTMRLVVGDSSATEVLTERRREIASQVKQRLQDTLNTYESGIDVVTVELQDVIPPTKNVQDAFNEVNRARQEKETRINEANREYLKAIPEAEGQARKVVQEAEGFKVKRVNEAQGDVAKFEKLLAEYQESKEITRRRLYLEAMEEVLPRLTRIYVVDSKQEGPLQVLDLKDALGGVRASRRSAVESTAEEVTHEN